MLKQFDFIIFSPNNNKNKILMHLYLFTNLFVISHLFFLIHIRKRLDNTKKIWELIDKDFSLSKVKSEEEEKIKN